MEKLPEHNVLSAVPLTFAPNETFRGRVITSAVDEAAPSRPEDNAGHEDEPNY